METVEQKEDRKYCVYLITNLVNGKKYVGYTGQGLRIRWNMHSSLADRGAQRSLYFAMRKHGKESFVPTILREGLSKEEACLEEKLAVQVLNLTDRNFGYNMTGGGEGGEPTEEIVNKICEGRGMEKDPLCGNRYFEISLPVEKLIEEYRGGKSSVDLAKQYSCSQGAVLRRLRAAGITIRTSSENTKIFGERNGYGFQKNLPQNLGSKRSEETKKRMRDSNKRRRQDVSDDDVVDFYKEGFSTVWIAKHFSMSPTAIRRRLLLHGVVLNEATRKRWKY